MKIKLAISLSIVLALGVLFSCDKNKLELQPQDPTEAEYFTQEIEFERAVIGMYAKLVRYYCFLPDATQYVNAIHLLPGDDITTQGQDPYEIFSNINPSDGRLTTYYNQSYALIGRANIVLEKLDEVADGVYDNEPLKDYHKGEAYFLRGLMYFRLWNVFGTAPLVTERVREPSQFTPPNSTGTELLDQAIEDFTEAAGLLPAEWSAENTGRATANAANGMLGKSLVFRGAVNNSTADYSAAVAAFNAISGLSLVPQFDDNFAFDTENNAESLFEFQASENSEDENYWVGDPDDWDVIGVMSVYWGIYSPDAWHLFGFQPFYATDKLIDAFDSEDPRLELSLDPANGQIRKYVTRDRLVGNGVGSVNNPRILRYADVLLLKAEAVLMSGGSKPEAISLINEVRTRARNMGGGIVPANYDTGETDEGVIFGWIRNERFIELAGEGHRWFDIRRWQMAGQLPQDLSDSFFDSKSSIDFELDTHLYFPIPTSETDRNPNIAQNPNY